MGRAAAQQGLTVAPVTATYTTAQGTPATGTVYLSPVVRVGTNDPRIITEKRVWADLDVAGSISVDVLASDDPSWLTDGDEVPYLVEERLDGLPFRSYWVVVPTLGLGEISDPFHSESGWPCRNCSKLCLE